MTNKQDTQPQGLDIYQAYLIRMWQDGKQGTWRASAQAVQGSQVVRFANLDRLFIFLAAQTSDKTKEGASDT